MVEAIFDWISEMRAGNLGFIIEVPNISLPHLEAWSHIKAWSKKITFEIEAPASIRGNTVYVWTVRKMNSWRAPGHESDSDHLCRGLGW